MVQERGGKVDQGRQVKYIILLCVLLLSAVVLAESAVDVCDRMVVTKLEEGGLHLGHNEESGEFIVVAHSQTRCADPSIDIATWAFCRDAFLKAHVKARREIANMVKGTLKASNTVSRRSVDRKRSRTQTAVIAMNAEELQLGVIVLATEDAWRDGVYAVSVAMAWSEKRDSQARKSMAGLIDPAVDWKSQLRSLVAAARIELLPPFGEFVDSNGFVHFFGTDVSDVLSCPVKGRSAALLSMEVRALARLQSVRDGAGVSALETQIHAKKDEKSEAVIKASVGGLGVSATGAEPVNTCVFEGNVNSEAFKRSLYAIVYATDCMKPSLQREKIESSNSVNPGVMIWNPNSGKFEKQ